MRGALILWLILVAANLTVTAAVQLYSPGCRFVKLSVTGAEPHLAMLSLIQRPGIVPITCQVKEGEQCTSLPEKLKPLWRVKVCLTRPMAKDLICSEIMKALCNQPFDNNPEVAGQKSGVYVYPTPP